MYLSRGDSGAIASMLFFARGPGLYRFSKRREKSRRMVWEKIEKDVSRSDQLPSAPVSSVP